MATIRELRKQASDLGVKNYSKMRKDELAAEVENAQRLQRRLDDLRNTPAPAPIQFVDADVQRIGNGSLGDAARFIGNLNAAHGRKGPSRKFRKMLRKAGFWQHAAVDVAKAAEYDRKVKAA